MKGTSISETTEVKALQSPKAPAPIDVTPQGIVIDVRLLQPYNKFILMDVRFSGRAIDVKLRQP